jgi:hypothetical protein
MSSEDRQCIELDGPQDILYRDVPSIVYNDELSRHVMRRYTLCLLSENLCSDNSSVDGVTSV